MSNIVEIKTKKDLSDVASGFTGYNSPIKLDTTEDRVYAFNHAEDIVDSVFKREKQGAISLIRSEALMIEKKAIMGDLWNANKAHVPEEFKQKWSDFLLLLDNNSKRNIEMLLKFAEYHESSKLAGVKNVAPNQGQFNALAKLVNKKTGNKDLVPTVRMYDALVKANNNQAFGSAQEVVQAFEDFHTKPRVKVEPKPKTPITTTTPKPKEVYVRFLCEDEIGICPENKYAPLEYPREIVSKMPQVTDDEWKQFVKKVSHAIHPDKGGTDADQMILNSFREMMKVVISQQKSITAHNEWEADYALWKKERGYESDFVMSDELCV